MLQLRELPWEKIHDFLLASGSIRDPMELGIEVIKNIYNLVPYDQARLYFIDGNGKVFNEVLFGVDKRWSKEYLEYYSQIENGRYSTNREPLVRRNKYEVSIREWDAHQPDEFITDYIKPQGLRYSTGFCLHDANHSRKCLCILDRTKNNRYTTEEIEILSVVQPELDNLHQNLFVLPPTSSTYREESSQEVPLTPREAEITCLLCEGITTANISKKLSLSISTVYRHIANIYNKLQVSSRQELIVRMLRQSK